jgi:hypothetical protein
MGTRIKWFAEGDFAAGWDHTGESLKRIGLSAIWPQLRCLKER